MDKTTLPATPVLAYPEHWFDPRQSLSFTELPSFTKWWMDYGLQDVDLQALQMMIMSKPTHGMELEGTGGLRKMIFLPPDWDTEKKGKLNVCFLYLEDVGSVILAAVYANGDSDHLTTEEREALRLNTERIKAFLFSKPYRCTPCQRRPTSSQGSGQTWKTDGE